MAKIILVFSISLFSILTNAQDILYVKGTVSSAEGSRLENVTINSIKSMTFTISNKEGSFMIPLKAVPDTLIFSHTGFAKFSVTVRSDKMPILVVLQPIATTLETIEINTGYQKLRPNEINGSVTFIDRKTLALQAGMDIIDRLRNVTSGVTFNDGYDKNSDLPTVRGISTLNGDMAPLIVMDNFIYEGDLKNINPEDVESITVLKDASASSIWGARAGNGVIVLTTRKGSFNQKMKLDFSANLSYLQKPDLSSASDMPTEEFINLEEFLFNKGYFNSMINRVYTPLPPAVQIFSDRKKGLISSEDSARNISKLKMISTKDQYSRYFLEPSITKQASLSLSGGTENLSWLVSGSYAGNVNQNHVVYNKGNFRIANVYRPVKNLQINLSIYYTNSENISGKPPYTSLSKLGSRPVSYFRYADEEGNALPIENTVNSRFTDTIGGGKFLDWRYVPLEDYKHNQTKTNLSEIIANIGFKYKFIKDIELSFQYQVQKQKIETKNLADVESFYARNLINTFSQLDRNSGVIKYIIPYGGILNMNYNSIASQNARGQINFQKNVGKGALNAMAGGEIKESIEDALRSIFYGYLEDPLTFGEVDFINSYPSSVTGSQTTIPDASNIGFKVNRFVSLFGNISYDYDKRIQMSASARRDGANILGVNTNGKWKPLWSTGIGWVVSNESFYNSQILTFLKVKSTYGYSGNVDPSRSALPIAGYGIDYTTNLPRGDISAINNPELRWEQVRQINFGLEFTTNKNVLNGSIDFYQKKSTDLYAASPYDYTGWGLLSTIIKNTATIAGKGFDVNINSALIDRKLRWVSTLLFNYNNTITKEYFPEDSKHLTSILASTGKRITPLIGRPAYSLVAYKWAGLDEKGNPQGYLNGMPSTDYNGIYDEAYANGLKEGNVIFIGSAIPTYFGSFINAFSWNKIELSIIITYKMGYYFPKPSLNSASLIAGNGSWEYSERWKEPGDELKTNVPAFIYPANTRRDVFYATSEINILKGDHLRLSNIKLQYTPETNLHLFKGLNCYVIASNLGLLWRANTYQLDPEYSPGNAPKPIFTFGTNIQF